MRNGYLQTGPQNSGASRVALIAGLGGSALLLGIVGTLGFVKMSSQQQQLAQMGQMIEMLSQRDAPQTVTRAPANDLLVLEPAQTQASQAPATQAQLASLVAAATAPAPVSAGGDDSTANKIRALVNAAVDPDTTTGVGKKTIENAERLETLAIIHAGVQELVAAVVAGDYDIHTNYEDANFSGRIHFAFIGHEEDQTELERFLARAAERGIVKHSKSVVSGDGKVNGHILLFDLVERALENGTPEEQRAGALMRSKALAMMAKDGNAVAPANAAGERFYTVESGDSLAYIALQFYGNTNEYVRIYEANSGLLTSPDQIRVGQRLRIPSA